MKLHKINKMEKEREREWGEACERNKKNCRTNSAISISTVACGIFFNATRSIFYLSQLVWRETNDMFPRNEWYRRKSKNSLESKRSRWRWERKKQIAAEKGKCVALTPMKCIAIYEPKQKNTKEIPFSILRIYESH